MAIQNNAKIQPRFNHENIYNNLFEGQQSAFTDAKKKQNLRSFLNNKVSSQTEFPQKIPLTKVASSNQKTLNNRNVASQSLKSESIKLKLKTEKKNEYPTNQFNYIPLQQINSGNQMYQSLYSQQSISFEQNVNKNNKAGSNHQNNKDQILLEQLIREAYSLLSRIRKQSNEKENGTNSMLRSIKKFLAQKIQKKQKKALQEMPNIIQQQKSLLKTENDFSNIAKKIQNNLQENTLEKTVSSFNNEIYNNQQDSKGSSLFKEFPRNIYIQSHKQNQQEKTSIWSSLETISQNKDINSASITQLLRQVVSLKQRLDQQEPSTFS